MSPIQLRSSMERIHTSRISARTHACTLFVTAECLSAQVCQGLFRWLLSAMLDWLVHSVDQWKVTVSCNSLVKCCVSKLKTERFSMSHWNQWNDITIKSIVHFRFIKLLPLCNNYCSSNHGNHSVHIFWWPGTLLFDQLQFWTVSNTTNSDLVV